MNSIVATDVTEVPVAKSLLETWGKNERMRHVPPVAWMVDKLEGDLRRRIERLCAPFAAFPAGDPRATAIDAELRALCRAIDRLADSARYSRAANHAPSELVARIQWGITHAVSCLNSLDANLFGRRYPFQTFERSKAEPLYAALLVVIDHVHRLTNIVRFVAPQIDEVLLEDLVRLEGMWDGLQPVTATG